MANESKPSRTQVEDLSVPQREMTEDELQKVQGGKSLPKGSGGSITTSESNITNNPLGAPAPPPTGISIDRPGVKVTD